jgi:vitamin B12 transporter
MTPLKPGAAIRGFVKKTPLLPVLAGFLLFSAFPVFPGEEPETEDDSFYDEFPPVEGEGITITGSPETTQQIDIITKEEIDRRWAVDLASLLEETLNLGVTRYGPYGNMAEINMRGFDTERIAILIDGIPANSPRSGEFDVTTIDLNAVERIEVIYGGSDTKYNVSGALGGVINIITVKKHKPGPRLGGSLTNTSVLPGRYNKQNGAIGDPQWQDLADAQNLSLFGGFGAETYSWSTNFFANRGGNHFLYRDYYDKARRKEGNEVWDTGLSASFVRDLPEYAKMILRGDIYYGDKNIPVSGYTREAAKQQDFSIRQNLIFDMPRAFRDDLAAEASLSYNWGKLSHDTGRYLSRHDEHIITVINRWNWYPLSWVVLRSGGDYRYIHVDSTNDGVRNGHQGGLYLSAELQGNENFLFISSVKLASDGYSVVPVPKLGVVWNVSDFFSLKNNYFRSFKFPDFDDLYWMQEGFTGNPDLRPEDGIGGDLSAEYRFKDWFTLGSTVYAGWTQDSIHWSALENSWAPQNIGTATFFGWDTQARFKIPFSLGPVKKIILTLSYKYMASYLLNEGLSFADDIRIPYMPMHRAGFSLDIPWEIVSPTGDNPRTGDSSRSAGASSKNAGSLLISSRWESSRYADTANITELKPYFLLNLTFNQQINKTLTVFAVLNNVLNQSYVSFADYPMPGITLTMGIRAVLFTPDDPRS